jgi:hypothetical protein
MLTKTGTIRYYSPSSSPLRLYFRYRAALGDAMTDRATDMCLSVAAANLKEVSLREESDLVYPFTPTISTPMYTRHTCIYISNAPYTPYIYALNTPHMIGDSA